MVSALVSGILASPVSREMSFRLEQTLELTDALWDLVPVVVAAGEQHDRQPPAEVADMSAAGQRLTSERRSHVRAVADGIMQLQEEALTGREIDESAVSSLTLSEALADPFGVLGRLSKFPSRLRWVYQRWRKRAACRWMKCSTSALT